jgi:hypothetical protein
MARSQLGSLTKEPALSKIDATIVAVTPDIKYTDRVEYARANSPVTHGDAPGLISKRFLLVQDQRIIYDRFLSLVGTRRIDSPFVRKIMFFVWAYRDSRIRDFVLNELADSKGKWRPNQVTNKALSSHFEQYGSDAGARKARSNFEFFLTETGIYELRSRTVNLDLSDGWLNAAAAVAAQHEPDPAKRSLLLRDPPRFLIDNGWQGLANATTAELAAIPILENEEPEAFNDLEPTTDPAKPGSSQPWRRTKPVASGKKPKATITNPVLLERANATHHRIEEILAKAITSAGLALLYNESNDLFFHTANASVLIEVKSCNQLNIHSQIRRGIGQLLEYRYVYGKLMRGSPALVLALETRPLGDKIWLANYLDSLGILLTWKAPSQERMVSDRVADQAWWSIAFTARPSAVRPITSKVLNSPPPSPALGGRSPHRKTPGAVTRR